MEQCYYWLKMPLDFNMVFCAIIYQNVLHGFVEVFVIQWMKSIGKGAILYVSIYLILCVKKIR